MPHLLITLIIIVAFVLISLVANRMTLNILKLKPTWRQVFVITGTTFSVQLALALPGLINPHIKFGLPLSILAIVLSVVLWCMYLHKFFQVKLAKSLLGVLIFYGLTAVIAGVLLTIVRLVAHAFGISTD
jgi:hypothetical protein